MHITFREVRERARGNWGSIIPTLAPSLQEAVDRAPRHVDCPIHGGKKDFRLDRGFAERGSGICTCGSFSDGFELLAAAKNYSTRDALYEVAQYLGLDTDKRHKASSPPPPRPAATKLAPESNAFNRKLLHDAWSGSVSADSQLALPLRLYLMNRSIELSPIPEALRFNPSLPYFVDGANNRKRCIGNPPAMLATVSDSKGRPVTLHRTYLDMRGNKSPVPKPKMLMASAVEGSAVGGAIRLFESGKVLGLTEGIETGLAVYIATGMPVWPCISTSFLKQVIIPSTVELVVIWADLDKANKKTGKRPGEDAALVLKTRLEAEGRQVLTMVPSGTVGPDDKGIDWLDIYIQHGKDAFPVVTWGELVFDGQQVEITPVETDESISAHKEFA
ncbi:MAG: DUF7146 domain-containing protein [Sulfuricaulis sp.]